MLSHRRDGVRSSIAQCNQLPDQGVDGQPSALQENDPLACPTDLELPWSHLIEHRIRQVSRDSLTQDLIPSTPASKSPNPYKRVRKRLRASSVREDLEALEIPHHLCDDLGRVTISKHPRSHVPCRTFAASEQAKGPLSGAAGLRFVHARRQVREFKRITDRQPQIVQDRQWHFTPGLTLDFDGSRLRASFRDPDVGQTCHE